MPFFTLSQAARQAGVGVATIHRALKSGKLSGRKVGRDWQIESSELFRVFPKKVPAEQTEKPDFSLENERLKGDLRAKDAEIEGLKAQIELLQENLRDLRNTVAVIDDHRKNSSIWKRLLGG